MSNRRYLPLDPITVSVPPFASTAFIPVNTSNGPKEYYIIFGFTSHIRRGFADMGPATTSDLRVVSNTPIYLWLAPGEGVRAYGTSGNVIQIGDTSK